MPVDDLDLDTFLALSRISIPIKEMAGETIEVDYCFTANNYGSIRALFEVPINKSDYGELSLKFLSLVMVRWTLIRGTGNTLPDGTPEREMVPTDYETLCTLPFNLLNQVAIYVMIAWAEHLGVEGEQINAIENAVEDLKTTIIKRGPEEEPST